MLETVGSCSHSRGIKHWSNSEVELLRAVGQNLAIAINSSEMDAQLVQREKMASLGQLVAGLVHEISNPVNLIHGNLYYASKYTQDLLALLHLYQTQFPDPTPEIRAWTEAIDLEFIKEDLPKLFSSMRTGTERIREIVLSLQTFSQVDRAEMKAVDLHEKIDTTLMLLETRLKAKPERPAIQVVREYGDLPLVECYAGQLNQVFMNILTNAIDALEELKVEGSNLQPVICIRTSAVNSDWVAVRIADNGPGIPEALQKQVFDPFFTTKPVGKGTGMGMAISYQIVTKKHGGKLRCSSLPGHGAEFVIEIPITAAPQIPDCLEKSGILP